MKKVVFIFLAVLGATYAKAADTVVAVIPKAKLSFLTQKYGLQIQGIKEDELSTEMETFEVEVDKDELKDLYKYLKAEKMIKPSISTESVICGGACGGT